MVDDVILALVHAELDRQPEPVFTRAQFERVRAAVQAGLIDSVFAAVGVAARIGIAGREAAMAKALLGGGRITEVMGADYEHMLK